MLKKLYNQKSKDLLIKRLESEEFERITCSFYKYFKIDDPTSFRDEIYSFFDFNFVCIYFKDSACSWPADNIFRLFNRIP